jgi:hypothetical protein
VREAIDLLGRPDIVEYTDIADAFTRKNESGEPCHNEGFQQYLDLDTDITCDCVLRSILRTCGYTYTSGLGKYVREAAG